MGSIFAGLNGNGGGLRGIFQKSMRSMGGGMPAGQGGGQGGGLLQKLLTQGAGPGSQDDGPLARLQIPNINPNTPIPNGELISAMQMPQTAMPTPQYEQGPGAMSNALMGLNAAGAGQPQEPQQPMQAPGLTYGNTPQTQRFQMPPVGNSFRGGLFGGSLA